MDWTTACPDWKTRIVAGQSLIPFSPLFESEANEALDVFGSLRMVDAPGMPTMAEVSRPWVTDFVASIFGAYDPESGRRLIQEFMMLISKKNGKSTDAAAIMLTALILNWRQSGEFIILAPTVEIANNSFYPARDMVRADKDLNALLQVQDHIRTITHRTTGATLKVVAADSETVGGKKAIGILVDELWLFGKRANAENMLREACGGLASRPEGFVIYLTTQSDEPPAGVFRQKLQYARDVRDGKIDDNKFLPVLYEFPNEMRDKKQYLDPDNFYITNPNLGASVDVEFLNREFEKAKSAGEESLRGFLAKHLNVEIGLNLQSGRWAGADFWESAKDQSLTTLNELINRSEVVVCGIDGGGLDDLLGLAFIGREKVTRKWLVWVHAWVHRIALERRKEIAPALLDFEKQGDLTIVTHPGDDVADVSDMICYVRDTGLLAEDKFLGVDPAGIGEIINELTSDERGFNTDQMVAVPQGWKLNGAIKTTERKVAGEELTHAGQPMMAWCVGNARVEDRGNAILITKQASGKAKIDPLMAIFNAVSIMNTNPTSGRSVYEDRGLRFV